MEFVYGNKISFIFPGNPYGMVVGLGEFHFENGYYPPRLYKVHDWNLKII
jgi:hypothetical protein